VCACDTRVWSETREELWAGAVMQSARMSAAEVAAPALDLEHTASPARKKLRGSQGWVNLARGGYGGRASADPGAAWEPIEPAGEPN